MAIEFHKSAAKHGYTRADALHAIENAAYENREFDRRGSLTTLAWVGPSTSGEMIEVFAAIEPPQRVMIFHCMAARAKIINKMRRAQ
ncbi:MAG: hypothetical protein Q3979_09300 [Actinomycetaceae bacterium]|nr:hypothetical protein [Actinomycetaceae bacterium]